MGASEITAGPWTIDTEGRMPWVWIGDFATQVPTFEDARLIAAAPDLLMALTALAQHAGPAVEPGALLASAYADACAAIAKATGGAK